MGFTSVQTGNRFSILTKANANQRYSYVSLVFDVLTSSTISQGTSSPIHPVQGGATVSDHIFTNNVGISFTAKVSDGNKVVPPTDIKGQTSSVRTESGRLTTLQGVNDNVLDNGFVMQDIDPDTPLTQAQADAMNQTAGGDIYSAGQTVTQEQVENEIVHNTQQNESLTNAIGQEESNIAEYNEELQNGSGEYRSYHTGTSNIGKQSSALNLLELIRKHRLLVDVLMPEGLYSNYVLSFDVLNQDSGDDLTISGTLTQYRFANEEEVDVRPYSTTAPNMGDTTVSNEAPKEVTDPTLLESVNKFFGG